MIPDNAGFYHVAYVVAVVLYGAYAVSIWVRRRSVRRRREAAGSGLRS